MPWKFFFAKGLAFHYSEASFWKLLISNFFTFFRRQVKNQWSIILIIWSQNRKKQVFLHKKTFKTKNFNFLNENAIDCEMPVSAKMIWSILMKQTFFAGDKFENFSRGSKASTRSSLSKKQEKGINNIYLMINHTFY